MTPGCKCDKCLRQREMFESWTFVGIGFGCYAVAACSTALATVLVWLSFGIAANIVGTVVGLKYWIRRFK